MQRRRVGLLSGLGDKVAFCEGLRTPAPRVRRTTVMGPASETFTGAQVPRSLAKATHPDRIPTLEQTRHVSMPGTARLSRSRT